MRRLSVGLLCAVSAALLALPAHDGEARAGDPKPAGRGAQLAPAPLTPPLVVSQGQRWSLPRRHQKPGLPFGLVETRHANGLTLVVVPMTSPGVIGFGTLVRVGARNESGPAERGVARLIERLMSHGTKGYPASRRRAMLRTLGANVNSYTNKDRTFYYLMARAESLEKVIQLESDRVARLEYPQAAFETETRAAIGEYRQWKANPWFAVWEKAHSTAFRRHPYGHVAIQRATETLSAQKRYAASRRFFKRYYTPDNTTLVIAGDVKPARAKALVDRYYGGWRGRVHTPRIPLEPPQTEARRVHVPWATPTVPRLMIAYRLPAFLATGNDSAAIQVINEISFGEASPLYRDLVLKRQLASKMFVENSPSRDGHLFLIFVELTRKEHAAAVERAINAELASLASGRVDARRVAAVRSHIKYSLLMVLNKPRTVLFTVARLVATRGSVGDFVTAYGQFDTVTATDLARVARSTLIPSRATYVTLHHTKTSPGDAPGSRPSTPRRPR